MEWVCVGGILIFFDLVIEFLIFEEVDFFGMCWQSRLLVVDQLDVGVFEMVDDFFVVIQLVEECLDNVVGVFLWVMVDLEYWLSVGMLVLLQVFFLGILIYDLIKIDCGVNVVSFVGLEEVFVLGYLWEEN